MIAAMMVGLIVASIVGATTVYAATVAGMTVALVATVIVLVVITMMCTGRHLGPDSPPAPPAMSLLGHLGLMKESTTPWVTLDRVGKDYGDVMSLKLGHWCVMLNTFEAIKDAAVNYLTEMAGRPSNFTIELMSSGHRDVTLSSYSQEWVLLRKLAVQNLRAFSGKKRVEDVAQYVLGNLQEELDKKDGQSVNAVSDIMLPAVAGILTHMYFGNDADPSVHDSILEMMGGDLYKHIVGPPSTVDLFPVLQYINAGGAKGAKDLANKLHGIMRSELERHQDTFDPDKSRDLTDGLISAWKKAIKSEPEKYAFITDVHLYQILTNYITGPTAGQLVSAYHTAALLVTYPNKQEKISELVTKATGRERMPAMDDLDTMPYVRAAVEEMLRFVCVAPISVPHATTEDITFRGYRLPARTTVFANLYDVHFGDHWKEPFAFQPERFLDEEGNFKPSEYTYPFGWGLRKCMGDVEALQISYLILAWITQNYKLSRVPGEEDKDLFEQDPTVVAARVMPPFSVVINKRF